MPVQIDEQPIQQVKIDESPWAPQIPRGGSEAGRQRKSILETFDPAKYAEYFPAAGSLVGGVTGSLVGGPPGEVVGSTFGTGLGSLAQSTAQHPTSLSSEDIKNALIESGVAGLTSIPGASLPYLKQQAMRTILPKIFHSMNLPEDRAALSAFPELNPTVGQATGSRLAQFAEGTLGSKELQQRLEQQGITRSKMLEDVRKGVTGEATPPGAETLQEKALPLRQTENQAWDQVRQHAQNNTQRFHIKVGEEQPVLLDPNGNPVLTPVYKDVDLKGPINTKNASNFAQQLKPEIDNLYNSLPDSLRGSLFKLKNTLDKLTNGSEAITEQGDHFNSFDTVKQLRSDIGELVNDTKLRQIYQTRQSGGLAKIRDLLDQDIADSIPTWAINPQQAASALASANVATKQRLKANIFDRLINDSTDQASKSFNPDTFINKMKDPEDEYRGIFSANDRNLIEKTMRALRAVQPTNQGGMFQRSMWVHAGLFGLGAMRGILTGNPLESGTEGLGLMVAAHTFADRVLMNPKYARLAAKLPSLPTDSFEAHTITKTLLTAMKGTSVYLVTPSGGKIQATIDEKGIPRPNFKLGENQ